MRGTNTRKTTQILGAHNTKLVDSDLHTTAIQILIAALCLLPAASATADSGGGLSFSVLEWWVVIGSLFIGVLISASRERQPLQVDLDRETANSSDTRQQSKTAQPRKMLFFAASGVFAGLLASISTLFPAVCTLGTVAILLFVFAVSLLGVSPISLSSILQSDHLERFSDSWTSGLVVALILASVTSWVINPLIGTSLVDSDFQLVAGIIAGLTVGAIIGELWTRHSQTDRADDFRRLIRRISGVATIALAIFVAGRIPEVPALFLWAVFLVVLSVYCGATTRLAQPASGERQLLKGLGVVMLIFGVIGLTSASVGSRNLNESFTQFSAFITAGGGLDSTLSGESKSEVFVYAWSMDEFDQMLAQAKQAGKPAAVDLYADWCLDCKRMDRTTFKEPSIVTELTETFDSIKIDITDPNDRFGRALRKRFKVFGPPALLFFDRDGNVSANSPVYGYLDVDELTVLLAQVK